LLHVPVSLLTKFNLQLIIVGLRNSVPGCNLSIYTHPPISRIALAHAWGAPLGLLSGDGQTEP